MAEQEAPDKPAPPDDAQADQLEEGVPPASADGGDGDARLSPTPPPAVGKALAPLQFSEDETSEEDEMEGVDKIVELGSVGVGGMTRMKSLDELNEESAMPSPAARKVPKRERSRRMSVVSQSIEDQAEEMAAAMAALGDDLVKVEVKPVRKNLCVEPPPCHPNVPVDHLQPPSTTSNRFSV